MLVTVTKNNPCKICGKPDQCSQSEDGLVCCFREDSHQDGYRQHKKGTSSDGRSYTIFAPVEAWHPKALPKITNEFHAKVYSHIISRLKCEPEEQQELKRRGILNHDNYGSSPFNNAAIRSQLGAELLDLFGKDIFTVPGISKNNPSGKGQKPWLEGPEGLMIPIRDYAGKIQCIVIRPRVTGDRKYLFLSSTKQGGASATPALHFPVMTKSKYIDTMWITEGALKADAVSNQLPIMATPANNLEPAFAFMESNPVTKYILAYDQDQNEQARQTTSKNLLKAFARFLDHDISLAIWDGSQSKGLDDLLQVGGQYQILTRADAILYLQKFVKVVDDSGETMQIETEFFRTEWSEALSLKSRFGRDMAFIQEWNDFLVWNGAIWQQDTHGPAILYKKHLDERLNAQMKTVESLPKEDQMNDSTIKWLMGGHKLSRLNNVVGHLKSESDLRKKVLEIPVIRNVLTCPNGTVDLATGELRKNKRSDWQQSICPTKFNPDAKCQRWLQLLDDVFLGSGDLIKYVQKLFGMALTGQPKDHVFPVFCGDGRNGKSTILGTIQQVLGAGLSASVDSNHLCKGTDRHPTWLASFHGKRLMVAQETARGAELNVSLVKQLTGGDQITCRRMHENEWTFQPTHTLILCTNEKPNIPESNFAIWSRISLVPFKAQFSTSNGNLDTTLPIKIMEESEGILAWLVQGAMLYQKEGLVQPEEVVLQGKEYRELNDPEQSITDWLNQFNWPKKNADGEDDVRSSVLYQNYWDWCLQNGIRHLGIKNFSIALTKEHRGLVHRTLHGLKVFRKK